MPFLEPVIRNSAASHLVRGIFERSKTVLTVTVRDTEGLPLPYAPITWAVTGSNNNLLAGSPNADVNGVATATKQNE